MIRWGFSRSQRQITLALAEVFQLHLAQALSQDLMQGQGSYASPVDKAVTKIFERFLRKLVILLGALHHL